MGGLFHVASGCGCKEVYRFPHITYPLLLLYLFFFAAAALFFGNFFIFLLVYIYNHRYYTYDIRSGTNSTSGE